MTLGRVTTGITGLKPRATVRAETDRSREIAVLMGLAEAVMLALQPRILRLMRSRQVVARCDGAGTLSAYFVQVDNPKVLGKHLYLYFYLYKKKVQVEMYKSRTLGWMIYFYFFFAQVKVQVFLTLK